MGQFVLDVFIFVTEKSITFKKRKYRIRQKKPSLSELTQILCGLLSLLPKYFSVKMKRIGDSLIVVSFAAVV